LGTPSRSLQIQAQVEVEHAIAFDQDPAAEDAMALIA